MAKTKLSEDAMEFFRKEGRKGGKKSAAGRMAKMTAEERSEVARKAAAASAKVRSEKAAAKKRGAKKTKLEG